MFTNIFKKTNLSEKTIFIVEDNELYAKSLESFLTARFPDIKIKTFAFGEACLLELYQNPAVIIMDHLLNANHSEAATGLSTIKKIKSVSPSTSIVLLSAQTEFDVVSKAISKYGCTYLKKDDQSFNKVEQLIIDVFNHTNSPSAEPLV